MSESEEELKGLLMKVKEKNEKFGSKFRKLRSWHLVPSLHGKWMEKQWKTVETVADFILGGSKITADGDCGHEIKKHSLEGKL